LPWYTVDNGESRVLESLDSLRKSDEYYAVDSVVTNRASALIRALPGEVSVRAVLKTFGVASSLPEGLLIDGNQGGRPRSMFDAEWEVSRFTAYPNFGRLDIRYTPIRDYRTWVRLGDVPGAERMHRLLGRFGRGPSVLIPLGDVEVDNLADYSGVTYSNDVYLLPNRPWQVLLEPDGSFPNHAGAHVAVVRLCDIMQQPFAHAEDLQVATIVRALTREEELLRDDWYEHDFMPRLTSVITSRLRFFDTARWQRGEAFL